MLDKLCFKLSRLKRLHALLAVIICLALLATAPPSEAQYFGSGLGFGYNGIGSSLLYPLNSLFYSGYGNSAYGFAALGSGFANNAMYNTFRNIPYSYMGGYPYYTNPNYSANNYPLGTPPNTNSPFNYNNYNPNQNQASGWNYSPTQTLSAPQSSNDPNDIFNSRSPANASDPNSTYKSGVPSVAPDRRVLSQTANGMMAPSSAPDTRTFALAGFFQTVNTRYKGNLFHALNQMDMRSWAESLALIQPGQTLSKAQNQMRKNQIATIIKDPSLDPQKKLDILRLLLDTQ